MPIIILRVNRLLLSVRKCRCKQPSIIKRLKKKKLSQPIQEAKRRKKKKRVGVQEEICMAPSLWTHRSPGLQTSLVEDLCFLSTSRWRNTSLSSSQGRDGLLSRSSPPSIGLHWAISPVWWISCSILLSWMIWGIIQKVSYSSFCFYIVLLALYCELLISLLSHTQPACSLEFDV